MFQLSCPFNFKRIQSIREECIRKEDIELKGTRKLKIKSRRMNPALHSALYFLKIDTNIPIFCVIYIIVKILAILALQKVGN